MLRHLLLALFIVSSASAWFAPLYRDADRIKGKYIIALKNDVDVSSLAENLRARAEDMGVTFSLNKIFRRVIKGFVADLSQEALDMVRSHEAVRYVEEDGMVYEAETWGLDRIDQRDLPLDDSYNPVGDGKGVHVYVLDTGIRVTHEDFEDRADFVYDAMGYAIGLGTDCRGHGTHCAGTIAGLRYGVAKKAFVHAVRVLGCYGSGSKAGVIDGMDWVAANGLTPGVVSMSLSGSGSRIEDEAVVTLNDAGFNVMSAASNGDTDGCSRSPARAPWSITVGATNINDTRAYFSNYGGCVDIFAPGRYITAAYYRSDTDYAILSGTSMATPHVAGVAAIHLGLNPSLTPNQLRDIIMNDATRNRIKDALGSPNLHLHVPTAA